MKLSLTEKTKPRGTPSHLLLYGPPKTGKNSAVALLPDHLVLNLDNGVEYVETCATPYISTIDLFLEAIDAIEEMSPKPKFLVVDTVDKLQELAFHLGIKRYNDRFANTEKSKGNTIYTKDDLMNLPQGGGWGFLRRGFDDLMNWIFELQIPTIWLSHVRYRYIDDATAEKAEKRMLGNRPRELALMGLICDKICADMCLIGYLFRDQNKLMMDTTPGDSNGIGTRLRHLDSRQFCLSVKAKDGTIQDGGGWEEIFGDLVSPKQISGKKTRKPA